jgi:beta-glucosidase
MVDVALMRDGVELWKAQVRMLLGSKIAVARVKVSGNRFSCHKYYFGLCQTFCRIWLCRIRKDYNTVDVRKLPYRILYFLLLKQLLMPGENFYESFNELNGIPATGNRYKREIWDWNFDGFVV